MKTRILASILALLGAIPALASYTLSVPAGGYYPVANHLNNTNGNTLNSLFGSAADGSILLKWNCPAQDFDSTVAVFIDGSGWQPNLTFNPGEGALLASGAAGTTVFSMTGAAVPPNYPATNLCPCGTYSLVSSRTESAATWESLTGQTAVNGAKFLRWSFANQDWVVNEYANGWSGGTPTAAIGESVMVFVPCCSSSKTVSCVSAWTFDPPATPACTNSSVTLLSTVTNSFCPLEVTRSWLRIGCGETNVCSQTVTVTNPPPTISAPAEVVVYSCSNSVPVDFTVTATNFCRIFDPNTCSHCPNAMVVCFPPSGSAFGKGTNLVTCLARDLCGNTNIATFSVVVLPGTNCCIAPEIVVQPISTFASTGGVAVISASATGTPPLSYTWLRWGTNPVSYDGPTLSISNITAAAAAEYVLVVTNACGAVTSSVAAITLVPGYFPDVTLVAAVEQYVVVGNNATFTLSVANDGPFPLANIAVGGMFSGVAAAFVSSSIPGIIIPSGGDYQLTLPLSSLPIGTTVVCQVTFQINMPGMLTFSGAAASVPGEVNTANNTASATASGGILPVVTTQPIGFSGGPGASGSLSAVSSYTPPATFEWRKNGGRVPTAGTSALSFPELHASDAGDYVLIVSTPWGKATSAVATVTFPLGSSVTASLTGDKVEVLGAGGGSDIRFRLGPANHLEVDDLQNGVGTDWSFADANWNRLVVELSESGNAVVFDDSGGSVAALSKRFEIYGGGGSNYVVLTSAGLNLAELPGLLDTLQAAPDIEVGITNLQAYGMTNLIPRANAMALDLYTNLVDTSKGLRDIADTNLFVNASNLVAQANQLSGLASNFLAEASWKFNTGGYPYLQFSNCLMRLMAQLDAYEDSLGTGEDPTTDDQPDAAMEGLADQMDAVIDTYESGAEDYDRVLEQSGDLFLAAVDATALVSGEDMANTQGPAFENLADTFESLAASLLEVVAANAESSGDTLSTDASNYEGQVESDPASLTWMNDMLDLFTVPADPAVSTAIETGTAAGCDRDPADDLNTKAWINIGGVIIGTTGNDKITAQTDTFLVLGLGGDDLVFGSTKANIIHGGSGDDEIHGQEGKDILMGAGGNDCVFGDEDIDLILGGNGNDNLHGGTNIDFVIGSSGNDKLYGDENADLLLGGAGDEEMHGGDGIDFMFGGVGADKMYGGDGYQMTNNLPFLCPWHIGNLMLGGADNDEIHGGDGIDLIFGLAGNDKVYSGDNIDIVFGNSGDDEIEADDGGPLFYIVYEGVTNGFRFGNLVFGGPGDDTVTGGKDVDLLFGGANPDKIRGAYTYDFWRHPKISCDCTVLDLGFDYDLIFGGAGNDDLDGGFGTDFVFGGPDNDTIKGNGEILPLLSPEMGFLFGGAGSDIITGGMFDHITLAMGGTSADSVTGSKFGVLNLLFGGTDVDSVIGNGDLLALAFGGAGNDTVHGGGFVLDLLFGGPDHDNIQGKLGVMDLIFGGPGDDAITGNGSLLEIQFGNDGIDAMNSGPGLFYFMLGNNDCDTMTGGALLGLMFGNGKDDTMNGGFGADIMFGNDGPDTMNGNGGPDIIFGNDKDDTLNGGTGPDILFGNAGMDLIFGGTGPDIMFGNANNDRILGEDGPDLIFGGPGDDALSGGPTIDLMFGGAGADCVNGDTGNNLLFGGRDNDYVTGGADGELMFGNPGDDVIRTGFGNARNYAFGNRDNDRFYSRGNADRVFGNRDNDSIINEAPDARLRGGRGDDQFTVSSSSGHATGTDVRVFGGPGTDTYMTAGSGSTKKVKSASSGTVSVGIPAAPCGEVRGFVWFDANDNGGFNGGESGAVGITVYLDLNKNGVRDLNEPYTVTQADDSNTCRDEQGWYTLSGLPMNQSYIVRQVLNANTHQTAPLNSYTVDLAASLYYDGRDFGFANGRSPAPDITDMYLDFNAATVRFTGAGGLADTPFQVLTSTNIALPRSSWQVLSTNVLIGPGSFSVTNSFPTNAPQRFFILQSP